MPQKTHTKNISARNSAGGRFFDPEKIFFSRISVSFAEPDSGVEKGVRGIWLFIVFSFRFSVL